MPSKKNNREEYLFLKNFRAVHRLVLCLGLGIAVFGILMAFKMEVLMSIIISWNTFSLSMIVISWITFFTTSSKQLASLAKSEDESRSVTFILSLISVGITFFGTFAMFQSAGEGLVGKGLHIFTSVTSVAFSWCLLHIIYTLRYAHLYYSATLDGSDVHPGGLEFPGEKKPDYIDFAYFAFVIGMTFQVSDVEISSSQIRRFALSHGLISFVFNTIIVALTINILAGLMK